MEAQKTLVRGHKAAYSRRAWAEARRLTLERDRHICQVQITGLCTGVATQADHIVPLVEGGDPYDLSNLRASCKKCNMSMGGTLAANRRRAREAHSRAW